MARTRRPKGIIDGLRVTDLSSVAASVKNTDGSLTISPTTGDVIASLNLSNTNTWAATQTFQDIDFPSPNTYDIASLTNPAKTLFVDDDGSFGIEFPTAVGTTNPTDFGIFCGGGGDNTEGGTFTFKFDDNDGTTPGTNKLVFDFGDGGTATTVATVDLQVNQAATRGVNKLSLALNQTGVSFTSSLTGTGTENLQFTATDGTVNFKSNTAGLKFDWAANQTMDINSAGKGNFGKWRADNHAFLQSWVASGFGGEGYAIFGEQFSNAGFVQVHPPALTSAANTNYAHFDIAPGGSVTVPAGTTALVGSVNIEEPNITATGTVTDAFTMRIGGAPTQGVANHALWVVGGRTTLGGDIAHSGANIGLFGATPVNQATAMTTQLTDLSGAVAPGAPDYAIATPIDSSAGAAWGFSLQAEFETVMSVILNLQTRMAEVEAGLDATAGIGVFA